MNTEASNIDRETVASFGSEWSRFDQSRLRGEELQSLFDTYFDIFPWGTLPASPEGFDMGCGSGRWAALVAGRVGRLHCVDPSAEALAVAERRLAATPNVHLVHASTDTVPLEAASQDFGYSLGVLHHIPDTAAALKACTRLLKPGAPFLLYLYYRFDNRPLWFRALWRASDLLRGGISRLPERLKFAATDALAAFVYWPLARLAGLVEKLGGRPAALPLSFYRNTSFYTMRTDSRDRFGTPLERRFTREEIRSMMEGAGLRGVRFSQGEPYWVAVGVKAA
ncbi:MAG TPA: class I SAM-dependent methyltransferase [Ramlibacter sp.]|uniref:class I SAM-dependent methyltransferase n=1 Tax=Ramlibacter sp. TaxID=1917967 RepID=UPI002ED21238